MDEQDKSKRTKMGVDFVINRGMATIAVTFSRLSLFLSKRKGCKKPTPYDILNNSNSKIFFVCNHMFPRMKRPKSTILSWMISVDTKLVFDDKNHSNDRNHQQAEHRKIFYNIDLPFANF